MSQFRRAKTGGLRTSAAVAVVAAVAVSILAGSAPGNGTAAPRADTQPPSVPQGMAFAGRTRVTVRLVWRAATDNVGVVGYRLYQNGARVGTTRRLSYSFTRLRCGTRYTFSVEAFDAAGNASYRPEAVGSISTKVCAGHSEPRPRSTRPAPKPTPRSGVANVWIDPDGGSCHRSINPRRYTDSSACRTMQNAYAAAAAGDTVNIVDGTYGSQTLHAGTKRILFRAAGPGRPSFGQIVSAAANITVRGILIEDRANVNGPCSDPDNAVLYPCGRNQTFDNVIVDGLNEGDDHGIRGVGAGFRLRNSVVRNIRDQKGFEAGADDMVIEHNTWIRITVTESSVHNECMYVNGGNRSVYRGNLFIGCPTMALFFTNWNGGPAYRDVLIENNVFGHTLDDSGRWHPSCALLIGWGYNDQNSVHGWVVRYNTFETNPCTQSTPVRTDTGAGQWYGNLGGIDCAPEWVYRRNVGDTCGGVAEIRVSKAVNDRSSPNAAPFYVNAPAGDFRLRRGAIAINKGDPKAFPRRDAAKRPRPNGRAPDAGAYEFRG